MYMIFSPSLSWFKDPSFYLSNTLNNIFIYLNFLALSIVNLQWHFFYKKIHFLNKIDETKMNDYSNIETVEYGVPQSLSFKNQGRGTLWQESPMQSNSFFLENCGY